MMDEFQRPKTRWEQARDLFSLRQKSYRGLFDKRSPHLEGVLKDLARFCRATKSTFDPDPRVHALFEGRREVWLRITEYLELTPEQLADLYARKGD